MTEKRGSVGRGLFWMILLSILLFWLPVVGSFLAGLVGGKKSGSLGNALLAAILPALILGALLTFLATVFTGLPIIGVVAGLGGSIFALSNVVPLLLGAFIGGLLA
jgi:hypothetical protein